MNRARLDAAAANLKVPTLLIRGDHDGITTEAQQEEILAGIAGSRLEVIADCGHLPTLEKPEATNAILKAWLSAQA